jgi:hypothetical protein
MQYYNILIILFEPFIGLDPEGYPDDALSPSQIIADSRASLETLFHLFYRRHGFDCYHFLLLQVLSHLGFTSVQRVARPDLEPPVREAARATLILCAKGLHKQGRNFYLAEAVWRVLREAMSPNDANLLYQHTVINDHESRKKMVARQIHGEWPVFVRDITQDPGSQRLDELLKANADSGVEDSNESSN